MVTSRALSSLMTEKEMCLNLNMSDSGFEGRNSSHQGNVKEKHKSGKFSQFTVPSSRLLMAEEALSFKGTVNLNFFLLYIFLNISLAFFMTSCGSGLSLIMSHWWDVTQGFMGVARTHEKWLECVLGSSRKMWHIRLIMCYEWYWFVFISDV